VSEQRRQGLILVTLLVVFAIVLWWRLGTGPGSGGGSGLSPFSRGSERSESTLSGAEIKHLQLSKLTRKPGQYSPGRDPFRFAPKPQPKARPVRRKPPPRVVPRQPPPRQAGPPRPQPPPLTMKFLGSFGPASRKIAVFTEGDEIYNALVGDVLQEKFIIDNIGYESADIKFVGFPDAPAERLAAGG
jgi:hypothetical protein